MSPIDRYLQSKGGAHNPPPPAGGVDVFEATLNVRDAEGWGIGSCFTAQSQLYLLYLLQNMDCRVWVCHEGAGSVLVVEKGELAEAVLAVGVRFKQGARLVVTAQGPDAEEAIGACRAMFKAHPGQRRGVYRRLRKGE